MENISAAPKRKRGRVVIIALALSFVAAMGGALVALGPDRVLWIVSGLPEELVSEQPQKAGAENAAHGVDHHDVAEGSGLIEVMPLDEMIVNITSVTATGRRTSRFLKINIALAVDPSFEGVERLSERKLFIRDAMQDFLRQLHEDDLAGSAGIALLKAELLRRARIVADTEAPREVLFADLVIQ